MHTVKRTVLVTGASSGIGRAIARLLLEQGHTVVGVSRDSQKFIRPHPRFTAITWDLSQLHTLPHTCRELQRQFPALDSVVFSAGKGQFGSLEEFSYPQIQALMDINFTSVAYLTKALLPALKRKGHGDLIYIGSEAALTGSRKGTVYCASKFALRGFTQALREECATSNVRVCLVNPGMVNTPFFDTLSFGPGDHPSNALQPEDVAATVAYVLASRPEMVVDEINLSPLTKVLKFTK